MSGDEVVTHDWQRRRPGEMAEELDLVVSLATEICELPPGSVVLVMAPLGYAKSAVLTAVSTRLATQQTPAADLAGRMAEAQGAVASSSEQLRIIVDDPRGTTPGAIRDLVALTRARGGLAVIAARPGCPEVADLVGDPQAVVIDRERLRVHETDASGVEDPVVSDSYGWPLAVTLARSAKHAHADDIIGWLLAEIFDTLDNNDVLLLWMASMIGPASPSAIAAELKLPAGAQRLRSVAMRLPGVMLEPGVDGCLMVSQLLQRVISSYVTTSYRPWRATALAATAYLSARGGQRAAMALISRLADRDLALRFIDQATDDLVSTVRPALLREWVDSLPTTWVWNAPQLQRFLGLIAFAEGRAPAAHAWSPATHDPHTPTQLPPRDTSERPVPNVRSKPPITQLVNDLLLAIHDGYDGRVAQSLRILERLIKHESAYPAVEIGRRSLQAYLHWRQGQYEKGDDVAAPLADIQRATYLEGAAVMFGANATVAARSAHVGELEDARRAAELSLAQHAEAGEPEPSHQLCSLLLVTETFHALGDDERAAETLRTARRVAQSLDPGRVALLRRHLQDLETQLSAPDRPIVEVGLSQAELRTLRLLATHLTVPEIAASLTLSPTTIRSQTRAIFTKLGASSRSEAVTKAREAGLV